MPALGGVWKVPDLFASFGSDVVLFLERRFGRHAGSGKRRRDDGGSSSISGQCGITVGGQWRAWSVGECLLLDDSFEHSVDLRTGGQPFAEGSRRLLLVVDVWHPDARALRG